MDERSASPDGSGTDEESVAPSPPLTPVDRLATIYAAPGPYVSVYLTTQPEEGAPALFDRWLEVKADLERRDAPEAALASVEARLTLPGPDDTAAVAILAASDGTTVVQHGPDPVWTDVGHLDTLPYATPLVEWHQRTLPHLLVVADTDGADVVSFQADHRSTLDTYELGSERALDEFVLTVARHVTAISAELVLVSAPDDLASHLVEDVQATVGVGCRVVGAPVSDPDDLADFTVRQVSDVVARRTVGRLRELRFLATHDEVVDGTAETIAALAAGNATRLLLNDDPTETQRVWIGAGPRQISIDEHPDHPVTARLADAAIRSAVLQNIPVHIIPATGPSGPEDNTAAVVEPDRPSL